MINREKDKGSVLLLALVASFLLSLIIAAGLTQKQTSLVSNNAFKQSNRALYLSMRGLHHGIELLRDNALPQNAVNVEFNHEDFPFTDLKPNEYYRSAPLWVDPDNPDPNFTVKPFTRYRPPHLTGGSIGSNRGSRLDPFHLYISSGIKTGEVNGSPVYSRRGVEAVIYFLIPTTN